MTTYIMLAESKDRLPSCLMEKKGYDKAVALGSNIIADVPHVHMIFDAKCQCAASVTYNKERQVEKYDMYFCHNLQEGDTLCQFFSEVKASR